MLRIDDKLSAAQTKEFVERADDSMDKALAAGAEPNAWLRAVFGASDMAYGVWPDSSARHKYGVAVLHGKAVLAQARDQNRPVDARAVYLRCISEAEAGGMCIMFGDDNRSAA